MFDNSNMSYHAHIYPSKIEPKKIIIIMYSLRKEINAACLCGHNQYLGIIRSDISGHQVRQRECNRLHAIKSMMYIMWHYQSDFPAGLCEWDVGHLSFSSVRFPSGLVMVYRGCEPISPSGFIKVLSLAGRCRTPRPS